MTAEETNKLEKTFYKAYQGLIKYPRYTNITFSQTLQDAFALAANNYKSNGFCLDIGCSAPFKHYNNTLLLQLFN